MANNSVQNKHKGYLSKWTNYIRGYQRRWFVLSNGCLSYYRSQNEATHHCRGTINLATSNIKIQDQYTIVISNEANQTFHLKALSENEAHQWITALHLAKDTAVRLASEVDSDYEIAECVPTLTTPLKAVDQTDGLSVGSESSPDIAKIQMEFPQRLYDLTTSVSLIKKNGGQLISVLKEFNKINFAQRASNYSINSEWSPQPDPTIAECLSLGNESLDGYNTDPRSPPNSLSAQILDYTQHVRDKSKTFQVSAQACVNLCTEFVNQIPIICDNYQRLLNNEREHRLQLELMVEELAKQLSALEKKAAKQFESETVGNTTMIPASNPDNESANNKVGELPSDDSDEEFFYDAIEDDQVFHVSLPRKVSHDSATLQPHHTVNEYESCDSDSEYENDNPKSSTLARVIVRSIDTRKKSTKLDEHKRKPSPIHHVHTHRRTASSGLPCTDFNCSEMVNQSMRQSMKVKSSLEVPNLDSASQNATALAPNNHLTVNATSDMKSAKSVPTLTLQPIKPAPKVRRKKIPERPNLSISLWGIMKNCIGKELSKIPVPVNFNEPLSMIQRLTEDFEYSCCLDSAAACSDSIEQMARVAAFTVSSYSTTTNRTGKPFNPLLGETFECDRTDDMGWRSIAEQVSHHPPAAALHCQSDKGWHCSQEFTMSSKFRGKYLAIIPLGMAHLTFAGSNNHYTWRKVTSTVHNIIVGKLWVDNHGEMDIYNHTTGDICHLNYKPYSYFSREPARRVTGIITDKKGETKYVLNGTWDEKFEGARVLEIKKDKHNQPVFETGPTEVLWKRIYPPDYTAEMYNFTEFALTLNEPEEGVAPTDSRLRPDQRLMENGVWDDANRVKEELEEKQRSKRRAAEKENEQRKKDGLAPKEHEPSWFKQTHDPVTDSTVYVYNNRYWETKATGKWGKDLPDIF